MKPIRYFGDIGWFSQRKTSPSYGSVGKALSAHIRYIANDKRPDLIYSEGLSKEEWQKVVEEETSKRWDARVAGKVIFALPNDLSLEQAKSLIREFVSREIGPSQFGFALHKPKGVVSGKDNLHAHVLFSARGKDGKKLRLNPSRLRELQKKWDEYLKRYTGNDPYRAPQRMRKLIRPYHVRPDSALFDPRAVEYIRTRRRVWVLIKEAVELEKAEKEKRVSPQGEATPRRPPVSRRPISSQSDGERRIGATPSQSEETQRLSGRETLRIERNMPLPEMPWGDPECPLSKIDERIRSLEYDLRELEWELEDTSRLNLPKRFFLKKRMREIADEIAILSREREEMKKFDEMTREWLRTHIELLYMRSDTRPWIHQVAVLVVNPRTDSRKQFLVRIDELESKLSYLRKLNAEGYNIYASVNILQPDAKTRKTEDFLPYQVAVYLDLDSKQKSASQLWKEIWEEIRRGRLPEPSWVIKSSKGNYQAYWIFEEPVEVWKLEAIMRGLNERFGLDHTHDVARVFRLPGLRNKKPGKDDLVMPPAGDVIWIDKEKGYKVRITKRKYDRETLKAMLQIWGVKGLDQTLERASRSSQRASERPKQIEIRPAVDPELERLYKRFYENRDHYKSLSEVDAAFVTKALISGYSLERVASFLALQRSDKPNPIYYARKTVEEVSKWLREEKGLRRVGQSLTAEKRKKRLRRRETFDPSSGPGL